MRLLERWLRELGPSQIILDLGCGAGSLRTQLASLRVIGMDVDPKEMARNPKLTSACAESHRAPFADGSFDFAICDHSLEHVHELDATIAEIRRVLKPGGRLFVSVPDSASASDRLYRLLFCGGGHWQRFGFEELTKRIESGTGLRLAGWKELASSFNYFTRRNFRAAPEGPLAGPLPRRMRWLGRLPEWCFAGGRVALNLASRCAHRCFSTHFSRYGWALAFGSEDGSAEAEPECWNVCMKCGATVEHGGEWGEEEQAAKWRYRCPYCSALNVRFG